MTEGIQRTAQPANSAAALLPPPRLVACQQQWQAVPFAGTTRLPKATQRTAAPAAVAATAATATAATLLPPPLLKPASCRSRQHRVLDYLKKASTPVHGTARHCCRAAAAAIATAAAAAAVQFMQLDRPCPTPTQDLQEHFLPRAATQQPRHPQYRAPPSPLSNHPSPSPCSTSPNPAPLAPVNGFHFSQVNGQTTHPLLVPLPAAAQSTTPLAPLHPLPIRHLNFNPHQPALSNIHPIQPPPRLTVTTKSNQHTANHNRATPHTTHDCCTAQSTHHTHPHQNTSHYPAKR